MSTLETPIAGHLPSAGRCARESPLELVQRHAQQGSGDDIAELGRRELAARTEADDDRTSRRRLVDRLQQEDLTEPLRILLHQQHPLQPTLRSLVELGLGSRERQALEVPDEEPVRGVLETPVEHPDLERIEGGRGRHGGSGRHLLDQRGVSTGNRVPCGCVTHRLTRHWHPPPFADCPDA